MKHRAQGSRQTVCLRGWVWTSPVKEHAYCQQSQPEWLTRPLTAGKAVPQSVVPNRKVPEGCAQQ